MPKYLGRDKFVNREDQYSELIEDRGVENIEHFLSFPLNSGNYGTAYSSYEYVWKKGDKLYKLANEYYGDIQFWWVIALWNNKPTDAHFKVGDVVSIPFPPEEIYADIVG